MGKRGPQPKYDLTAPEIVLDARELSSFKSLVSKANKDLDEPAKMYYDFTFKPNSSKVTAIKKPLATSAV